MEDVDKCVITPLDLMNATAWMVTYSPLIASSVMVYSILMFYPKVELSKIFLQILMSVLRD